MVKNKPFSHILIFSFLLLDLISSAQVRLKIINYSRVADLSSDSIIKVTVRFTNQTNKDFIFFNTIAPLSYENPSEFFRDSLIPPSTISIFTDSQGQIVLPKVQFNYYQVEYLDFEARDRFEETQTRLISLQDSLKEIWIKETQRNPFLVLSGHFKDIKYHINTKDFLFDKGIFYLRLVYESGSVLWFDKSIRDKVKSQYKDAEIYFGKIQSQFVKIKINDSRSDIK